MEKAENNKILAAALQWYHMAGVDVIVSHEPTDWFKVSKQPAKAPVTPLQQRRDLVPAPHAPAPRQNASPAPAPSFVSRQAPADRSQASTSTAEAVMQAQALAAKATSLEDLKQALADFDGCSLKKMAKNLCFADGNPQSSLMLVGEAPGRDEDLAGVPFVGRAGQLLDKMLLAAGLSRPKDVWITNSVYWRPPGNRTPTPPETEICRPFLERQIELIQPKIVVALGGAAAKHLLQTTSGIMRLRGKWHEKEIGGQKVQVFPTLHPAFLLRTPAAKKLAWQDLLSIREKLHAEH